jgi:glutamate racemase
MRELSIGVFDSGVGGLTVLSELIKKMPDENYIYFGDISHLPYGNKSEDAIKRFSFNNSTFLIQKGIKILVIACNTSTAVALDYLKSLFNVPILGVIEPAVDMALSYNDVKRIGVIGTRATIKSNKYKALINSKKPEIEVFQKATPLFVPLIEEGWINNKIMDEVIDEYLKDFKNKIDLLILGCTHYPIIKNKIIDYFDGKVKVVDSSISTAIKVYEYLKNNNLLNETDITLKEKESNVKIYLSDDSSSFEVVEKLIFNRKYGYKKIFLSEYQDI